MTDGRALLAHSRAVILTISALLVLPLFVTGGHRVFGQIRVPDVQSGDEPHYLVMIHSLLDDRDLDLANNYRAAHRGGWRRAAGSRERRWITTPCGSSTVPA